MMSTTTTIRKRSHKALEENSGVTPKSEELKPRIAPELPVAEIMPGTDFTGIARSVQCYLKSSSGHEFKNYRIVTLHIKNGKVEKAEFSDPYANFEALVKMELANELGLLKLNNDWAEGKTLQK